MLLVGGLLAASTAAVYATGGTTYSFVHVAYIPILLAAFFFGPVGGVLGGVVAGVCIGPLMPLDVQAGIEQTTVNWVLRALLFAGVGAVAGTLSALLRRQIDVVRRLGLFDPVTMIPNRSQLIEDLTGAIAKSRAGDRFSLVTVGLESLSSVQSAFGDGPADGLRRAIAARLKEVLPPPTKFYDLGGGLFAAGPLTHADPNDAERDAAALVRAFSERVVVDNLPLLPDAHAGVAAYPDNGAEAAGLVRASVSAYRESVELGRPQGRFDESHDIARRKALQLVGDLQAALRLEGELTLAYQPKVRIDNGQCVGVEALLRWNHPRHGLLLPGRFIEAVERTALIQPLTLRVADIALRQLASWGDRGIDLHVSINVSTRNLLDDVFLASLRKALVDRPGVGKRLQLEVTETSMMEARDEANGALRSFREFGVTAALDDFGTGHSSLAYLNDLTVDDLKLDRSFLRRILTDRKARLLVENTIRTAHQLGLRVVAEGVEDAETLTCLGDAGCDLVQGFLIARPLAPNDLEEWLRGRLPRMTADERDSNAA